MLAADQQKNAGHERERRQQRRRQRERHHTGESVKKQKDRQDEHSEVASQDKSHPRLPCHSSEQNVGQAAGRNGYCHASGMARVYVALICLALTGAVTHSTLGAASEPSPAPTAAAKKKDGSEYRAAVIARAKVWQPTDVASMDLKTGPISPRPFATGETITCTYLDEKLGGKTPKFACTNDDNRHLKVKYGGDNGEVYAEVLASRLLWALGFGADHMYSVRVVCRGCPSSFNGVERNGHESVFDPAAVEHKMPGATFRPGDGWSWEKLDLVDERAGGATRAERDALKLLAVFIQHTDSKANQQRLICLDETDSDKQARASANGPMPCDRPFMLIQDAGVTFGRANRFNGATRGSANLKAWSRTSVWQDANSCVGNLPKSATGTLDDPAISEEGRRFLADLLTQLSDAQIHDLFEAARVTLRLRDPGDAKSGFGTIDEWVAAFKQKRDEIVQRRCTS